jgi:alkylation response protein AidB-like acyl-CoA dehydrogenase
VDFSDTPEEATFRAEARDWIAANAPHHLAPYLERSSIGRVDLGPHDVLDASKAWRRKKYDAGWACLNWPKAYGGRDVSPIQRVIWQQEEGVYGWLNAPFGLGEGMCAPTIMVHANERTKARLLRPLGRGDEIWCQLFSEPGAGSDLAGLRTRAVRDGEDWIVDGQKVWTSGAHLSDYAILLTRTDPSVPKHKGLTMFYVAMRSPGIDVRPIKQMNGRSGFNEVFLSGVRVPDSQRLGEVGEGWRVALTTLMNERLTIGGGTPTGFAPVFELLKKTQTGGAPALADGALRAKVATWYWRSAGLKYTAARLTSALSRGEEPGPEASIGKLVAGVLIQEIAMGALDVLGLAGAVVSAEADTPAARVQDMLLRSPGTRIEGGTDEIMRNIIAERVLGLPADIRVDKNLPFKDTPRGV